MEVIKVVMCPVCWHEETFRAIKQKTEPARDDTPCLRWHPPEGGARGQIATMWDGGYWRCETCCISLPPRMAAMMIDAVLRVSDPDCDSYDGETFEDAKVADRGGAVEESFEDFHERNLRIKAKFEEQQRISDCLEQKRVQDLIEKKQEEKMLQEDNKRKRKEREEEDRRHYREGWGGWNRIHRG